VDGRGLDVIAASDCVSSFTSGM